MEREQARLRTQGIKHLYRYDRMNYMVWLCKHARVSVCEVQCEYCRNNYYRRQYRINMIAGNGWAYVACVVMHKMLCLVAGWLEKQCEGRIRCR